MLLPNRSSNRVPNSTTRRCDRASTNCQIRFRIKARTKPLVLTNPGSDQGTLDPKLRRVHAREAIDELERFRTRRKLPDKISRRAAKHHLQTQKAKQQQPPKVTADRRNPSGQQTSRSGSRRNQEIGTEERGGGGGGDGGGSLPWRRARAWPWSSPSPPPSAHLARWPVGMGAAA